MAELLCLGNFVVDVIGKPVDRLPPPGQLLMLDRLETHLGGNGPNCALAAARLGIDVAVAGRVGDDLYGRFLTESLAKGGVETQLVRATPGTPTGLTIVAVDSRGERSFMHHYGANACFRAEDVDLDAVPGARWLHAGSHFVLPALDGKPLAGLLRGARERGMATSLDVCWDRSGAWLETLARVLPEADWFLPNETEARAMTGREDVPDMAAELRNRGARNVVITCGERGCYVSSPQEEDWIRPFRTEVVDATGAGDCFIAGFLAGQLRGWELRRCLFFGNACGALAVRAVGATRGMRSMEDVEYFVLVQAIFVDEEDEQ